MTTTNCYFSQFTLCFQYKKTEKLGDYKDVIRLEEELKIFFSGKGVKYLRMIFHRKTVR